MRIAISRFFGCLERAPHAVGGGWQFDVSSLPPSCSALRRPFDNHCAGKSAAARYEETRTGNRHAGRARIACPDRITETHSGRSGWQVCVTRLGLLAYQSGTMLYFCRRRTPTENIDLMQQNAHFLNRRSEGRLYGARYARKGIFGCTRCCEPT